MKLNKTLKNLMILVKMQLKEKLDLSWIHSKSQSIFKIVMTVVGFVLITALAYGALYFAIALKLLSLTARLPITVLIFIFTIMQVLSILSATLGLMRSLYFSGDNQILLTTPVNPQVVFFSKLIVFYVNEVRKNFNFTLPVFIAFGLVNYYGISYFLILPVTFLLISFLPVALGALLSIPLSFISQFLRDKRFLQLILTVAGAAGGIYAFVFAANSMPSNIDIIGVFGKYFWAIQDLLNMTAKIFAPFAWVVQMTATVSWTGVATFFGYLGAYAILMLLVYAFCRPLYFRMVSKPYEHKTATSHFKRKNHKQNKYLSTLKKEVLFKIRTPNAMIQSISSVVILPLMILLLNRIFSAMNTRLLGDMAALFTNFLVISITMLASNLAIASIFSSEGKAIYILKTTPKSFASTLLAKITIDLILSTASLLISVYILSSINELSMEFSVLVFLSIFFLNLGHICWSAEMDITNPQYQYIIDGVHSGTNPNETKSMVIALIAPVVVTIISVFLALENYDISWFKTLAVAATFFFVRAYLLYANAKVYFKDI